MAKATRPFFMTDMSSDRIMPGWFSGKFKKHKTGLILLESMLLYVRFQKKESFGFLTKRSADYEVCGDLLQEECR